MEHPHTLHFVYTGMSSLFNLNFLTRIFSFSIPCAAQEKWLYQYFFTRYLSHDHTGNFSIFCLSLPHECADATNHFGVWIRLQGHETCSASIFYNCLGTSAPQISTRWRPCRAVRRRKVCYSRQAYGIPAFKLGPVSVDRSIHRSRLVDYRVSGLTS